MDIASDNSLDDDHDEVIRQMKEILEGRVQVAPRRTESRKKVRLPKGADLAVMLVNSLRNNVREIGGLDSVDYMPEPPPVPPPLQKPGEPSQAAPAQQVAASVLPVSPKPEISALPQVDIPASLSVEMIATSASWPPVARREVKIKPRTRIRKRIRLAKKVKKKAKQATSAPVRRQKTHPRPKSRKKLTGRQKLLALLARRRRK